MQMYFSFLLRQGQGVFGSWEPKKIGLDSANIGARVNQHPMAGSIGTSGASGFLSLSSLNQFLVSRLLLKHVNFTWARKKPQNPMFLWGPDLPTKVTGVPTGLGVASKDVVVPKNRTSDARNGLSCGKFRRRSGWWDDGMTGGWEWQFSCFFFKSFCCWTHVDSCRAFG